METVAGQRWVFELIRWGGTLVFLCITLFPFYKLSTDRFSPTRWWHVVGAYLVSLILLIMFSLAALSLDSPAISSILSALVQSVSFCLFFTPFAWPFLVFYCAYEMYGDVTGKVFWSAWALFFLLGWLVIQAWLWMMAWGVTQAFYSLN